MTDLKFNILKLLYESYPSRQLKFGDIINSVSEDPNLIQIALKELVSHPNKPIEKLPCNNIYKLTDSGAYLYEQLKKERDQESQKERQRRFDNKVSVASVLVPLVTFILGLFVEHFTEIVSFLLALFE